MKRVIGIALTLATAAVASTTARQDVALKDLMPAGTVIGVAINQRQSDGTDTAAVDVITKQFNQISPENLLKFQPVHPAADRYAFEAQDRYVQFGLDRGMQVIGHNLVWHQQTPAWVFQGPDGKPADRDTLLTRMRDHIHTVVGRYKGKIHGWDVVNEAIDEDGSLRKAPWHDGIGDDYVAKAFEFAHEADPDAELYYNDYNLEKPAKRAGVIRLVKDLQARGLRIDAIGNQGHWALETPAIDEIEQALADLHTATGLKVNYSELDINLLPPAGRGADPAVANPYANGLPDEKQQALAKRYADIFGVIVKHHDWIGRVTFWGLSDADSWLNRGRANYPLLWDRQRQPKPAFQAIVDVLRQARASAAPPRPPIVQQLTFAPYHANGIYGVGETVGWTVTPGPTPPTYAYKWTIRRNNAVVLKTGELDLSGGSAKIEIVADQPEMLYVAVEAHANLDPNAAAPQAGESPRFIGGNTGRNTGFYAVGAAVAPREIGLSTPRPADFDTFWNTKLAAQANVPINPALTPVTTDVPGVDMNIFQLDALGSKAHGYVAKPAKDGKFPALIQLQYAGVYALNAHADAQRAAEGWLMLNVDSHDKLPSDPSGGVPRGYQAVGNTDRETSYFLDMYLRDSRVLDYLLTRPDWDGKTIVLTGGSMGGQQSMTLAGLRPDKISAVLVCVPAGADTNGDLHGRKAGYPNWPSDNPAAMRTALYFDPVNFASHITAPVMAGMGFIDTISPPAGVWTMLNQVRGPVETFPLIESEHDNLTPDKARPCSAHVSEILDRIVHGATFAPAASK